ncbi:MAG: hypothetical protein AAF583_04875 [Pseudomonadota bacterium]
MNGETWWDYFDEDPYEKIGRQVPGAMGQPITVVMPRISWAYIDWLLAHDAIAVDQFFIDNDLALRSEYGAIDDWMEGAVRKAFLYREKHDALRPAWLPAALPAEYMDI